MRKKPIIAIMYDFDKTLCTKDMQEYSFIPNVGLKPKDFWKESNSNAEKYHMDRILSYMYLMIEKAHSAQVSIHRSDFVRLGKDLKYFPGVEDWFARINSFCKEKNVDVEHYIISSGLHEIIEGSSIYKEFKSVYASEYLYDENDVPKWPKTAINYTTKTQFLFRINKGVTDVSNDNDLNKYTADNDRRIPFRNMIYLGDGITDVPCMKLVKVNGGYSIAVYQRNGKKKVEPLLTDNRVDFIEKANYSKGEKLEDTVKAIICKIAADNLLLYHSEELKKSITKRKTTNGEN